MKLMKRDEKAGVLRKQDMIPGVVYGHGIDAISVKVPRKEFVKSYEKFRQTKTFNCEIDQSPHQVYIKDVQRDVLNPD